jgi:acetyl-CoA acetyltransferase
MCALIARRHMHEFGTTHRQMGHVAVAARAHATRNPRAVMHGRPLTLEEHGTARVIADPFRLHDCCLETDGACALIVVSAERARDLRRHPVHVLAAAEGGEGAWGASLFTHAAPAPAYPSANAAPVARRLWEMAGCGPADIDVVQLYENFSGMVLMALEDFGFCGRGEGGPFVEDGKLLGPDGALPLNTAGGNLAEAYVHGLNLVVEGVRQMRGESTCQVRDAELCLVGGGPGVAPTSALVLRRG